MRYKLTKLLWLTLAHKNPRLPYTEANVTIKYRLVLRTKHQLTKTWTENWQNSKTSPPPPASFKKQNQKQKKKENEEPNIRYFYVFVCNVTDNYRNLRGNSHKKARPAFVEFDSVCASCMGLRLSSPFSGSELSAIFIYTEKQ